MSNYSLSIYRAILSMKSRDYANPSWLRNQRPNLWPLFSLFVSGALWVGIAWGVRAVLASIWK